MNRNRGCDKSTPPGRKSVARASGARATLFNRPSQASRARLGPCPPMPRHRVPVPGGADQPRLFCSSTWFYFPRQTNGQRTLGKGLFFAFGESRNSRQALLVCCCVRRRLPDVRRLPVRAAAQRRIRCRFLLPCHLVNDRAPRPDALRTCAARAHRSVQPLHACAQQRVRRQPPPLPRGRPRSPGEATRQPPGGGGRRRRRWWCRGPCSSATSRRTKPRPYTSTPF